MFIENDYLARDVTSTLKIKPWTSYPFREICVCKIPKLYSLLSYMILFSFTSHCLLIYDFFLFCEQICNRNFYIFVWVLIRPLFPPSFLLSHFAFFGMGTQFSRHIRVTCGCSLVSLCFLCESEYSNKILARICIAVAHQIRCRL